MILVTGGTGFLGSHLVRRLVADGQRVRVFGTFMRGVPREPRLCGDDIEYFEGDVRDDVAISEAMTHVETVYHLAGIGSPSSPVEKFREILDVNVLGTENVLKAAALNRLRRVVVASSASVYGNSAESPKTEDMRLEPKSIYAVSKASCEYLCEVFHHRYGLHTVALRYFNVYGPGHDQDGTSAMVVPRFVRALRSGSPVTLHGDGNQTRDFVFIDDVIDGTLQACRSPHTAGLSINIASGTPTKIKELVLTLAGVMGVDAEIIHQEAPGHEVHQSVASIKLARNLFGYRPTVTIDEGIREIVMAAESIPRGS